MRRKFKVPTAGTTISIAASYRSYLGKLMSPGQSYRKFNFFADILSGLQTQEDSSTSTFSIQVHNGHYLMKYSPDMVKELDERGAGIVIAHELGHAALSHIPRMIRYFEMFSQDPTKQVKAAAVIHVAADYALNSWLIDSCGIFTLEDLKTRVGKPVPDTDFQGKLMGSYAGIHPSDVGLPPEKSLEWYIGELSSRITDKPPGPKGKLVNTKGDSEGEPPPSPGAGQSDAAGGFLGKLAKAVSQMMDQELQDLIEEANIDPQSDLDNLLNPGEEESLSELADKLSRDFTRRMVQSMDTVKTRGTAPGTLVEWLDELTKPPEVDWRQELRNQTKSAKPSRKKTTLARPRRRHISLQGLETSDYPGKRKNPSYEIVFGIDTSASVSSSELAEIFTELRGILAIHEGTEVTVVECDTTIGKIYHLSEVSDLDTKVTGRGGTSFDPVFEWIGGKPWKGVRCKRQPDLLIYATDGECPLPPVELRVPQSKMLWLISSRGRVPNESGYYSSNNSPSQVKGFCDYGRFLKVSQ